MDRLEAEFGPGIRATPDNEAAWVTPVLFAAAGILVVVGLVRRWIRPREEAAAKQNGRRISDADRVRVQAELTAFRDEP
jgi:cytochrome c-type biogenesis protein CcmH/NrfF